MNQTVNFSSYQPVIEYHVVDIVKDYAIKLNSSIIRALSLFMIFFLLSQILIPRFIDYLRKHNSQKDNLIKILNILSGTLETGYILFVFYLLGISHIQSLLPAWALICLGCILISLFILFLLDLKFMYKKWLK